VLALFVLTHCYISCPEVSARPFLQLIGTAMGTPFTVVYNTDLNFVEKNIIYCFNACFSSYFRLIDNGIRLWHSFDDDFQVFSQASSDMDPSIKCILVSAFTKPSSWICQLRFQRQIQPIQSSMKFTANLVMHMPIFSTAPLIMFDVRKSFLAWI
jgi:hypothetical protein